MTFRRGSIVVQKVILGARWGPSADIWSVACVIFELITGGDYLFDPASGSRYSKDDDHIAQIIELMGEFPKPLAFSGKYSSDFFNRKGNLSPYLTFFSSRYSSLIRTQGELRHIQKLRFWPLDSVLHEKYLLPKEEAELIASFITPMLRLNPEKRAKAADLIHHKWLEGVVVQGEIDVIRRMEDEERRRKGGAPSTDGSKSSSSKERNSDKSQGKGKGKATELDMRDSESDAMKPVEDEISSPTTLEGGVPKLGTPAPSSAGGKENAGRGGVPTLGTPHRPGGGRA
ncbi:hypothetical protein QCA50_017342 [Cerrena zonata]|uniref:non-specific serine/threonine protein kinase n=1 Tax=Cerrena zonata TaxID=2478898 RepID=A0AAW0FSG2_9APHY